MKRYRVVCVVRDTRTRSERLGKAVDAYTGVIWITSI
jgi:hypothetical protein